MTAHVSTASFAAELPGKVIRPADAGYDDARRVWNALHDRRPALIVSPVDADEVAYAIAFANERGLPIAVRSGGHSLAGFGTNDGGLVIDLSAMRAMRIDPQARTAWVETGATAGDFTTAMAAAGLIVPFGDSGTVGIGGITLGGGEGWLSRKLGLTIDSLTGAEVVTADGRRLVASETEHQDLFWALRGGGGNFGVVTRFRFALHPIGQVLGGTLILPATPESVRSFIALADAAPDELTTIALVMRLAPLPAVPEEALGKPGVFVTLVWSGDLEAGERALRPFRELSPIADTVRPMAYPEMYELMPDEAGSFTNLTHTMLAEELDEAAIKAILDHLEPSKQPSEQTFAGVEVRVLGGAIARVPADATAFAHRERKLIVSFVTAAFEPAEVEPHRAWLESMDAALQQLAKGAYPNFIGTTGDREVRDAYPEPTYHRLAELKRRYDPDNVFRGNLNIQPAAG